ncbi:hypothetical protein R9X47_04845 [Wukongibacter baidiensis]|uniref:hypothetical protein n=1 Tax=Wukongibacter baidiensis TaxID=1723361 RepID=UPI003D7F9DAA
MENIKKQIESYGFTTDEITENRVSGYYCVNSSSNSEFILDFTKDNFKNTNDILEQYSNLYQREIQVVLLIQVNDNAEEILYFVENKGIKDQKYLIYDEDDEIEFFLKDLWNIVFNLKKRI